MSEELTLMQRTLNMIDLAKSKGYVSDQSISPVMFESWMQGEKAICNTACAMVAMWLRDTGKESLRLTVWVEKRPSGKYMAYVRYFNYIWNNFPENCSDSYELEWIFGITHALQALPPGAEK
jgi:hypothetical protein